MADPGTRHLESQAENANQMQLLLTLPIYHSFITHKEIINKITLSHPHSLITNLALSQSILSPK